MIYDFLWNWLPWLYNKGSYSLNLTRRVLSAGYREAVIPKQWYILNGDTKVPVYSTFFPNIDITAQVRWICTTNPSVFISPSYKDTVSVNTKHVSYLGFLVHIPGYDPIDLTEWINTVQWRGNVEPSPIDLFSIWSCETRQSFFHLLSSIKIDLITDTGDSISKGLNDSVIYINNEPRNSKDKLERSNPDRVVDSILSSSGC
jgi:hypothetical protein